MKDNFCSHCGSRLKRAEEFEEGNVNEYDKENNEQFMDSYVELKDGTIALVQSQEKNILKVDLLKKIDDEYEWLNIMIDIPVLSVKRELDWNEVQALNIKG